MHDSLTVLEHGRELSFTFSELNTYHGGGFPGGVAQALKAMQAAFPWLAEGLLERREVSIVTAFGGPGARDTLEAVTRALTDGRLVVDRSIGRPGDVIDDPPGPYVFRFSYRSKTVEASILPGHVLPEFVQLGAKKDKNPDEVSRHEELKAEMAFRLLKLPANQVYHVRSLP